MVMTKKIAVATVTTETATATAKTKMVAGLDALALSQKNTAWQKEQPQHVQQ